MHCEDQAMNDEALRRHGARYGEIGVLAHSLSRPPGSEAKAIGDVLRIGGKHGVPTCICHVSTREGLGLVLKDGRALAEATIHHS